MSESQTIGVKFGTTSIRGIVKWAHTKRGGKEVRDENETEPVACHLGYLACE